MNDQIKQYLTRTETNKKSAEYLTDNIMSDRIKYSTII
jgi:hypothetical protein